MKEIPLTQGKVAVVDDRDFDRIAKWKWFAVKQGSSWYAKRATWKPGRIYRGDVVHVLMHHAVLGVRRSIHVDHRDGNGLDNRRSNLRVATQAQNSRNRRKLCGDRTTSRYKGVSRGVHTINWKKPWRAELTLNRSRKYLGYFATEIGAALAYDAAAHRYFGKFAAPNFPKGAKRCSSTTKKMSPPNLPTPARSPRSPKVKPKPSSTRHTGTRARSASS